MYGSLEKHIVEQIKTQTGELNISFTDGLELTFPNNEASRKLKHDIAILVQSYFLNIN